MGPVRLVVSDRLGGVSRMEYQSLNLADHVGDDPADVAENRDLLARRLGIRPMAIVHAEHGARVRIVDVPGTAGPGDVLVTTTRGLGLLALSADCVAGAIAAPDVPALAVFHSGWRGVVADTAGAAVAALVDLGARPETMSFRLGPSICGLCYEVSDEVADQVARAAPPARSRTRAGTPAADIGAGVRWQLQRAGVPPDRGGERRCTLEDPNLFSHRRDGVTGRQGVLAALEEWSA